ncbi:hypothetical protein HY633_00380 [Candidatus Uhrbacteria bacterium]|nr:hypothetical protein [Candidatus Uhrbacteria bacterium]
MRKLRTYRRAALAGTALLMLLSMAPMPVVGLVDGLEQQTPEEQRALQTENAKRLFAGDECGALAEGASCAEINDRTKGKYSCQKQTNGKIICSPKFATQGAAPEAEKLPNPVKPELSIPIPTIKFSDIQITSQGEKRTIDIPWIGDYIAGVYRYAVSVAGVIAAVIMMIGGFQYLTAGGDAGRVTQGKERIQNALIGLFLSLGVYIILNAINPDLVTFKGLQIQVIKRREFIIDGDEGVESGGEAASCDEAVTKAKAEGKCPLPDGQKFKSPTGGKFACNYHFKDANYNYKDIKNLDFPAGWGQEIKAPFAGTVTYVKHTDSLCGNEIKLAAKGGGDISICHVKDFTDASGNYIQSGSPVIQGAIIGHLGGNCCEGEKPPEDWRSSKNGWCKKPGPKCTDPTRKEECSCQPWQQSGNTSGPHVHVTYRFKGTSPLICLE